MAIILKTHLATLKKITQERKAWLVLSAFVMLVISFLIFDNKELADYGLLWPVSTLGIVLCVIWWYWVMRIIRLMLVHKKEEVEVLLEIVEDVKEIKAEVLEVRKSFSK